MSISTLNLRHPHIFLIIAEEARLHDEMEEARMQSQQRPVIIELVEEYLRKADHWKTYLDQHRDTLLCAQQNE